MRKFKKQKHKMQVFETVDTKETTLVYDRKQPSSHKRWFMKTFDNKVWEEDAYNGDAVFGNKNYFVLLAETNMSPSRLKQCKYLATELGHKIYNGQVKLIKMQNGKPVDIEIKWPEICADDEKPWKNRKPVFKTVASLYYPKMEEECECDYCCSELSE